MSPSPMVYWRAKPNSPAAVIGGTCPMDDVPSYGEVGSLDLPTELTVTYMETVYGPQVHVVSPPVFCASKVYRYKFSLRSSEQASLEDKPLDEIRRLFWTQSQSAPIGKASHENWWWYNRDGYWRHESVCPLRLIKRWTRPLIETLVKTPEKRAALLAEWDEQVARHNAAQKRESAPKRDARKRYGPRRKGMIVVAPHAISFTSYQFVQIFTLKPFGRRNQLGLFSSGNTRFKVSAGITNPVSTAWFEDADIAPPIAAVAFAAQFMATPVHNSHDAMHRIRAYLSPMRAWMEKTEAWFQAVENAPETACKNPVRGTLIALDNALNSYCFWHLDDTMPEDMQRFVNTIKNRRRALDSLIENVMDYEIPS